MKTKKLLFPVVLSVASMTRAALVPLAPIDDARVPCVPDDQKAVMNLPTYDERLAALEADAKGARKYKHSGDWRKAAPLVLEWRRTQDESEPWKVEVALSPDFSDARVWYLRNKDIERSLKHKKLPPKASDKNVIRFSPTTANLEVGRTYYWRVSSKGRCGPDCKPGHGCDARRVLAPSPVARFRTEDLAPRWIAVEGDVRNFRDLGGRRTADGRRVKQGRIFRSAGLNANSVTGEVKGKNFLTMTDAEYLIETLGIKTDLDLRSKGEIADMKGSPIGSAVNWINNSSAAYDKIFTDYGKEMTAFNFRVFCNPDNYPILFHCIGGADRTGSLAYVLNGVLGVDRHELETDWETTFYPILPEMRGDYTGHDYWCGEWHFDEGFAKYGDADTPWQKRIELYLIDCGITQQEIDTFRSLMLE